MLPSTSFTSEGPNGFKNAFLNTYYDNLAKQQASRVPNAEEIRNRPETIVAEPSQRAPLVSVRSVHIDSEIDITKDTPRWLHPGALPNGYYGCDLDRNMTGAKALKYLTDKQNSLSNELEDIQAMLSTSMESGGSNTGRYTNRSNEGGGGVKTSMTTARRGADNSSMPTSNSTTGGGNMGKTPGGKSRMTTAQHRQGRRADGTSRSFQWSGSYETSYQKYHVKNQSLFKHVPDEGLLTRRTLMSKQLQQ